MRRTLIALLMAAAAPLVLAETTQTTTTTTTSSSGVITEYTPGETIVLKESAGPVHYRVRDKVTYVTKSGKTLTDAEVRTRIKVGAPISVSYVKEGPDMIVNRVEIDD